MSPGWDRCVLVAMPSSRVETARNSLPASGYAGGRRGQKRGSREGREAWLMGQVEERGH